ncbi:hypothetical protein NEMBOFW57_004171 [Staphylotrichum longicolle]|uniref:Uncharacterized protein n=1 Tax=Staphylotrichum longicolle TaxID=669026 RepID=A0AAD4I3D9_9PEZI|nr:hypothetical protein NEMBOFW57_004171 [Staphylotrichum longicolle]
MRPALYLTTLVAAACGAHATGGGTTNPPIRNIYTFPKNTFIENIAVRSNSKLLVTSMSVPDLFSIDPTVANPTAPIVHTFANASGISGITEVTPDVFALVTGVWDLANTRALPGTLAIWTVDFTKTPSPQVKFVTSVPDSLILNGLARHPYNPRLLLAADSAAGAVWRIDVVTGAHDVAISSPLLTPTGTVPGTHLGINGLRSAGAHIYFTNSAQKFFGRVAVDWQGNALGAIEVISNSTAAGADVVYDDIALDLVRGKAWIASHPDYAVEVKVNGGAQRVVADAAKLLNPTSAAFGRGGWTQQRTLYVTNGGEFVGMDLVNEGVVALDLTQ